MQPDKNAVLLKKVVITLTAFLLSLITSAQTTTPDTSGIIYVTPSGTGNGSSWSSPTSNLQGAINAAGVTKVFVAVGTYMASNISMKDGVEIYGGFDPNNGIVNLSQNRILPSPEDFSIGSIINAGGANHVIHNSNIDINTNVYNSTLLDGFTLTGVNTGTFVGGQDDPNAIGGGIYVHNSSSRFNNLVIRDNMSYMGGAGMAVDSSSSVLISNSYIIRNKSYFNATAIYVNQYCDVHVQNVEISRNNIDHADAFNATSIATEVFSDIYLTNVTISNNTVYAPSYDDKTITCVNFGKAYIRNSVILGQKSAIYAAPGNVGTLFDIKSSIINRATGLYYYDVAGDSSQVSFTHNDIFADTTNNIFSLKGTGPAVNTGANSFYPGLNNSTKDLYGNPRLFQDSIDMGAYEFNLLPDSAGIIYVKPVATGTGMGNSWANATSYLNASIHISGVQKVFVAKGTYHVGANSFIMKNGVAIYGGFDPDNGISSLTDNRILPGTGYQFRGSILDGDNARPVIWNDYTSTDPLTSTAVLDGFTLTHAAGTSDKGCIYNNFASPTLNNLYIVNNTISGIYNLSSSPDISNTAIVNNIGSISKGLYQNGGSTGLYNVTIANNGGGGIVRDDGFISIYNSIVFGTILGNNGPNLIALYSFIEGNSIAGAGNVNTSGYNTTNVFVNVANYDYSLRYLCPAVNAGNNGYLSGLNANTKDLAGSPRVAYGVIDMGAYECTIRPDSMGIVYVKTVATGTGIGNSWANATNILQYAIDAKGAQKVFVAVGNYNIPSVNTSYVMKNGVAMYGGFEPDNGIDDLNDTRITNDTSATTGSILNGIFQKPVIWNYCAAATPMNNTAILDGFTVINGRNMGDNGGGIFNRYASPILKNLVIKNNKAAYGGGIYNINSSPQIINATLLKDSATYSGAGIYNEDGSPSIINVIIKDNVAALTSGGGIYHSVGTPLFSHVTLQNNTAGVRGGGLCILSGSGTIDSLAIIGNTAGNYGGGFYNQSGPYTINQLILENNTAWMSGGGIHNNGTLTLNGASIIGNNVVSGNGGGLYNESGSTTITNLEMNNNTAGNDGAGLYNNTGSTIITNLNITNNTAGNNGGGIYNKDSLSIVYTTADNNAAAASGGFLYNDNGKFYGRSMMIKSNTASSAGGIFNKGKAMFINAAIVNNTNGGFAQSGVDTAQVINSTISGNSSFGLSCLSGMTALKNSIVYGVNGSNYYPQYSFVEGNTDLTNGNIDASGILPADLFVNPAAGDYHLLHNSPLWDKGNNDFFPNLDLWTSTGVTANEKRLIGQSIEIGAYEYQLQSNGSAIMYVKPTATGTGDGSSWMNATNKLQDAIDAVGVQQVWVAKGLYETGAHSFIMKSNVNIYGGFDPDNGIADLSQNRIMPDTTGNVGSVLDGQNIRPVFWHYFPSYNDRLQNALLDGFTIRNGYTSESGGGMNNGNRAYPALSNIVFKNNVASGYGGGMVNKYSNSNLIHVTFVGNSAGIGGGVCNLEESKVDMNNVSFFNNAAVGGMGVGLPDGNGGGICNLEKYSEVNGSNIKLQNNTAIEGAAISNYTGSTTLNNVLITDNVSDANGAVYVRTNNVTLNNATIANNINNASAYQFTGNIVIETDTFSMIEPWFYELYGLTDYMSYTFPKLFINNSIVYDNFSPVIINVATNNFVRKNTLHRTNSYPFTLNSGASTGNIDGGSLGIAAIFSDPSAGDYSLKTGSPVINAGSNSLFPGLDNSTLDLAGNPRLFEDTIDMGAYEFNPAAPLPVKLLSFTATKQGAISLLQWTTANEQNSKGFDIERSVNGSSWASIGFISSLAENGNSTQQLDYRFVDNAPLNGKNFYRLKQIDFDGNFEYSPVRMVSFESSGGREINIYPNPASEQVTITGLKAGETVILYDATGRTIRQLQSKNAVETIFVSGLGSGMYHIQISNEQGIITTVKLVVSVHN